MRRTLVTPCWAIALAALVLLAAPAADARPPRLSPLHAVPSRAHGGRIADARGRTVPLRGVNVNALQDAPGHGGFKAVFGLRRGDARRIARIGFNVVRLAVSWSAIEPHPGRYDERYLDRIARAVRRLAKQRIYTIVDMHQDAYSASLQAPRGLRCPSGQVPAIGYDGAPAWATLDGGAPRCGPAGAPRETFPGVLASWKAFFDDSDGPGGVGIMTRYVRMWRHVARRFARSRAVAGFDLMNEPGALAADQQVAMSRMYGRALRAIRAGERSCRRPRLRRRRCGRRHIVFFEPSVIWSVTGQGAPPPFRHDRDVAYAPHIYEGGLTPGPVTRAPYEHARAEARGFGGAPVLIGEWGADPDRARDRHDRYFIRSQRLQDRFGFGATLWVWRESCGSPELELSWRAGRPLHVWGLFEVDCADNSVHGMRRPLVRELRRGNRRAHVRAAVDRR